MISIYELCPWKDWNNLFKECHWQLILKCLIMGSVRLLKYLEIFCSYHLDLAFMYTKNIAISYSLCITTHTWKHEWLAWWYHWKQQCLLCSDKRKAVWPSYSYNRSNNCTLTITITCYSFVKNSFVFLYNHMKNR